MKRWLRWGLPLLALLVVGQAIVTAQNPPAKVNRAKPPQFSDPTAGGIFFSDVFAEALNGDRPASFSGGAGGTARPPAGGGNSGSSGGSDSAPPAGGLYAWSKIISAEAIQDEVKRVKLEVDQNITTPGKFASSGFKDARRHFTELAMLFGIIAEYDGDVRWKKESVAARDLMARAGFNSKVGTVQAFNECKLRKDDLQELIGGGTIPDPPQLGDAKAQWDKVLNRSPLMQRLEMAYDKSLAKWVSSEGEFSNNVEGVLHEAQIIAAIAEVIKQPDIEFTDDETYLEYCDDLRKAALEIVDAVKLNNYEKARTASGQISQSCTICHEGYRS